MPKGDSVGVWLLDNDHDIDWLQRELGTFGVRHTAAKIGCHRVTLYNFLRTLHLTPPGRVNEIKHPDKVIPKEVSTEEAYPLFNLVKTGPGRYMIL